MVSVNAFCILFLCFADKNSDCLVFSKNYDYHIHCLIIWFAAVQNLVNLVGILGIVWLKGKNILDWFEFCGF